MKLSQLCATAALAFAGASAMAIPLGSIDLTSGSAAFGNTPIAGSFVDTLTFSLTTASLFNGAITSVVNGNQDVDFTSIVLTGPTGVTFTLLNPDPVEVWASPGAGVTLAAGSYTLTLTGINSAGIGSYAGNLAVTPIPEPQTLALMLAGVAVLGFIGKRRLS